MPDPTEKPLPVPSQGGSYRADPVTGALTLVSRTQEHTGRRPAAAEAPPAPAPKTRAPKE